MENLGYMYTATHLKAGTTSVSCTQDIPVHTTTTPPHPAPPHPRNAKVYIAWIEQMVWTFVSPFVEFLPPTKLKKSLLGQVKPPTVLSSRFSAGNFRCRRLMTLFYSYPTTPYPAEDRSLPEQINGAAMARNLAQKSQPFMPKSNPTAALCPSSADV